MIKEYFTDGLLQIAIFLSLMRTDLDSFIGLSYNNHRLSAELQETFLGSLSGYTQTDVRSRNLWNAAGEIGVIHPKSIYNSYPESIFRELHSLSGFQRFDGIDRNLNAFLVNGPDPLLPRVQRANTEPDSSPDAGQTADGGNGQPNNGVQEPESAGGNVDYLPYSDDDLTKEEMELIEVLWRQDIDLGIGREMFEASLRQEPEKEVNIEQSYFTQETKLVEKSESSDNQSPFPVLDLSANYIIDGETGEIVSQPSTSQPTAGMEFLSLPDILFPDIVGLPNSADATPSYENDLPALEQRGVSPVDEFQPEMIREEVPPPPSPFIEIVPDGLAGFSNQLTRQNSLEQRWEDVIGLLELPSFSSDVLLPGGLNETAVVPDRVEPVVQNVSLADMTYSEPLLLAQDFQRTSLSSFPIFPEADLNVTYRPTGSGVMTTTNRSSPGLPFGDANATFFNMDDLSSLRGLMSTNYSELPETNNIPSFSSADLESLFQGLFDDGALEGNGENFGDGGYRFDESNDGPSGGDGVSHPVANEDSSRDSAISSLASPPLQSYQELMDQSDGADEATGGKDVTSTRDLDFEKYHYDATPDFRSGSPFLETNSSTSSNDTSFRSSKSVTKHVYHNHTYVLQPGQISREEREEALKREREQKATRSRDEKRAKEMKLPFSIDEIINTPVEDFTQMTSRFSLSEGQQQLVRDIRRRGKNKQAAQNCRKRKLDVIQTLEEEVDCLHREHSTLLQNRRHLNRETTQIKDKLVRLQTELFRSLRDDNGQPYSPSEYSLQQLPDGNLFLVPKNNTVEKGQVKPTRKRKPKRKE